MVRRYFPANPSLPAGHSATEQAKLPSYPPGLVLPAQAVLSAALAMAMATSLANAMTVMTLTMTAGVTPADRAAWMTQGS